MAVDFLDMLKRMFEGESKIPAPSSQQDPVVTGAVNGPVPVGSALPPAEEEKKHGSYFARLFQDDPTKQDALSNGLLSAGAAMMMNGGPSSTPTNFLQIAGSGLDAGQKAFQGYRTDETEMGIANAKLVNDRSAQASKQNNTGRLKELLANVGVNGLSPQVLAEIAQIAYDSGDEATFRDAVGMIQQLQQTGAKNGMVAGDDGNFELAGGYGESLNETERQKADGRKSGEAKYATTSDITNYNEVKRQNDAAGIETPSIDQWLLKQNQSKTQPIQIGPNSKKFLDGSDDEAVKRVNGYIEAGSKAKDLQANVNQFIDLSRQVETGKGAEWTGIVGPYAEAIGIDVKGLDKIQAMESITQNMLPSMRVPGEGSQSDTELKQKLKGLVNINKTAEGNKILSITLNAVSDVKMKAAEIARRVSKNEISWQDGEAEIAALPSPFVAYDDYMNSQKKENKPKKVFGTEVEEEAAAGKEAPPSIPTVNTEEDRNALPSGTVYIGADGQKRRKR
jgi:hypothetical protein